MRKKKAEPFRATKAVRSLAREVIGSPKPSRLIPPRKQKSAEKHKPTLGKLLEDM